MPRCPPENHDSALFRQLTRDIWDEYNDKCDEFGVSFKTCILSGCQNLDSGIGCYAGSADSYTAFKKFFDKVIWEFHQFGPDKTHFNDFSVVTQQLEVLSVRVSVSRNIEGYKFGPAMTNEERVDIVAKVE